MKPRVLKDKGRTWVHYQGRTYRIDPKVRAGSSGDEEAESDELTAPFTCKVVKLYVKNGQKVKAGDPIVSVEAMKMEYTYDSPKDATIATVNVREGDILDEGKQFVNWV